MSSADHHSGRQPDKGVNILLQLQDWINPVVRCCQPMKAVDKQPSADAPVMAPISVSNGLSDVANPPRVLQHVRLSDEQRRHQTAKLLQYIEAEHTDGRLNAMREGIWIVKGYDGGSKVYTFPPRGDVDVLVKDCMGTECGTTDVNLSQGCRILAISKNYRVQVLCESATEGILIMNCEHVEVIIGHRAPRIALGNCNGVILICGSPLNEAPLISTRHCSGVMCQCAMTSPGQCSVSDVIKAPKFQPITIDGNMGSQADTCKAAPDRAREGYTLQSMGEVSRCPSPADLRMQHPSSMMGNAAGVTLAELSTTEGAILVQTRDPVGVAAQTGELRDGDTIVSINGAGVAEGTVSDLTKKALNQTTQEPVSVAILDAIEKEGEHVVWQTELLGRAGTLLSHGMPEVENEVRPTSSCTDLERAHRPLETAHSRLADGQPPAAKTTSQPFENGDSAPLSAPSPRGSHKAETRPVVGTVTVPLGSHKAEVRPVGVDLRSYDPGPNIYDTAARAGLGIYVAHSPYVAVEGDEIGFEVGERLQIDGLGGDSGWLTATVGSRHGLVPSTHIRALHRCRVVAAHDYTRQTAYELSFCRHDIITLVCRSKSEHWLVGELDGQYGFVPEQHLEDVDRAVEQILAGSQPLSSPPRSSQHPASPPSPIKDLKELLHPSILHARMQQISSRSRSPVSIGEPIEGRHPCRAERGETAAATAVAHARGGGRASVPTSPSRSPSPQIPEPPPPPPLKPAPCPASGVEVRECAQHGTARPASVRSASARRGESGRSSLHQSLFPGADGLGFMLARLTDTGFNPLQLPDAKVPVLK